MPGRVALRPRVDLDPVEMTAAGALNEFGRLTRVVLKHARDAFVSRGDLAAQWRHGSPRRPTSRAPRARRLRRDPHAAWRRAVLLPPDPARPSTRSTCATPRSSRRAASSSAAWASRSARASPPRRSGVQRGRRPGAGDRRNRAARRSKAATWCGSTTDDRRRTRLPDQRRRHPPACVAARDDVEVIVVPLPHWRGEATSCT